MRTVILRNEHHGRDSRHLSARLDADSNLVIEGQDLGPGTAPISRDGEYEYSHTVLREHIPQLLALLNAPHDAEILGVLTEHWTGMQSYELERLIASGAVPTQFSSWSG